MSYSDFITVGEKKYPTITIEVGEFNTHKTTEGIGVKMPVEAVCKEIMSELPYNDELLKIFAESFKDQFEGHPDKFESGKLVPLLKECLNILQTNKKGKK